MKKTLCIVLALVMALGIFASCGGGSSAGKAFKIGGMGPLTGGAAIYGTAAKNGATIAVEEINALGGIQFELKYEDDEHNAEKAVNAYNSLKDWGAQVTLGSVTSTPANATKTLLFEDRVFALTPSASSTAVLEGNDNYYQMCFTDPNQGTAAAQYIFDNQLGEKVAVIYNNEDVYSKGIYETFAAKASELNLNVVSVTTFTESSQTDFSVQIEDAKNKGADFIFLPIYYTPASLIFAQADAVNYHPKYFGVDGMDGILTLEGFNTALAEGVILLTPFNADSSDAKTKAFVTKYQEKYGEIPNQFAADGYDCVYAIYEAINSSKGDIKPSMKAGAICDKLIAIFNGGFTFNGVTGENMTWDASGAVSKAPKGMVIQNGVYVGLD